MRAASRRGAADATVRSAAVWGRAVPSPRIRVPAAISWDDLRAELQVPKQFPPEVLAEAQKAAASPRLSGDAPTALPFFTIAPAGSLDLDQAMCLERYGDGFLVRYAIADV